MTDENQGRQIYSKSKSASFPATVFSGAVLSETEFVALKKDFASILAMKETPFHRRLFTLYLRIVESGKAKINNKQPVAVSDTVSEAKAVKDPVETFKAKLILSLFICSLEMKPGEGSDKAGFGFMLAFLRNVFKTAYWGGTMTSEPLNGSVNLTIMEAVNLDNIRESMDKFCDELIRELIETDFLFSFNGLFNAACALLVLPGIFEWYVKAATTRSNRTKASNEDVDKAKEILRTFLNPLSPVLIGLMTKGTFHSLFEMLMLRPNVPFSLVSLGKEKS